MTVVCNIMKRLARILILATRILQLRLIELVSALLCRTEMKGLSHV